jgi:hypothetical protein
MVLALLVGIGSLAALLTLVVYLIRLSPDD